MIYGAIFGDIAGSAYEFNPVENRDFEMIVPKSRFTDDTVMTLAIANWLMENPDDEDVLVKQMQTIGAFYPGAGYGPSFAHWLISLNPQPYNSWGNGSAMRVSPCGWVAKTLAEAEELAKKSAEVTHNHPEGIKGAQAVAAAIWMARNKYSKQEIKDYISDVYDYDLDRTVQSIIDKGYGFAVSCQKSVPEAIIAFLESTDYESAVRNAISLRGDADTQGCIAGSIAEAFYGFPEEYKEIVEQKLDKFLLSILNKFNKQ